MRFLLSILLICCLIELISCSERNDVANQIAQLNTSDTFRFEFPNRNHLFDSLRYKKHKIYEQKLGLEIPEKGFDSILIRIDYGGPMTGYRIVELINRNGTWSAEVSILNDGINPGFEDSVNVDYWKKYSIHRIIKIKTPKSGWKKFIRNIFTLDILTLPTQENIPGFKEEGVFDGVGVTVTIATKKNYRLYDYGNPDLYMKKHEESKKISEILKLIDEEFELQNLWDYTNENIQNEKSDKPIIPTEMKLQDVDSFVKKKAN